MIKRLFRAHYAMMREIAAKAGNFRGVCPLNRAAENVLYQRISSR